MFMRKVNRIDLKHIINDFACDVDLVSVETFTVDEIAFVAEVVNVRFNNPTVGDDHFNIGNGNPARPTATPSMVGQAISILLDKASDLPDSYHLDALSPMV